jgi:hypothetical protein
MGAPRCAGIVFLLACVAACGGDDVVMIVIDAPTDAPPDAPTDAGPDATPSTTVILSEDFNQLVNGSNLVGQGGWTGAAVVPIGPTMIAGSRGVAGRTANAANALGHATRPLTFMTGFSYRVTFKGLASTTAPASENSGAGLSIAGAGVLGAGWIFRGGTWEWHRDFVGVGPSQFAAPTDVAVIFEMNIDTVANEVWGAFTPVGGSRTETPHVVMTPAQFGMLTGAQIRTDYRNGMVGVDIDDLVVTQIPNETP